MVSIAVCSNAVVLLLLNHCLLLLPLFVGFGFCQCLVMLYLVYNVLNHLDEEERSGCFTLTIYLLTFSYKCSVSLPYSAVSWSALSDCGIFWSYSLTPWSFLVYYNQNKSVLLCKLLNCLSVYSNSESSQNNYCYSRSILSRVCKIWKTNDIKPTSWCAFQRCFRTLAPH